MTVMGDAVVVGGAYDAIRDEVLERLERRRLLGERVTRDQIGEAHVAHDVATQRCRQPVTHGWQGSREPRGAAEHPSLHEWVLCVELAIGGCEQPLDDATVLGLAGRHRQPAQASSSVEV